MAVRYFENDINAQLKDRRRLSAFLVEKARHFLPGIKQVHLGYVFCSDDYLLEKNIAFLDHHTLTDILTFDLSEYEDELSSEIYISIERVRENAEKFGVSYQNELHRVIFHGMLHLCGFKDKSDAEQQEMRRQEQLCLNQYFAPVHEI